MVAEHVATTELAANVKTVQAFDEMLVELTRLGVSAESAKASPDPPEPAPK